VVHYVAQDVRGKGGGRPALAQACGSDQLVLSKALAGVPAWVGERVK
jgi:alanyl-tRNA synthetase